MSLWSSSQAVIFLLPVSNHSKVEAIPLSALLKDITSELAGLSSHYPFLKTRRSAFHSRL